MDIFFSFLPLQTPEQEENVASGGREHHEVDLSPSVQQLCKTHRTWTDCRELRRLTVSFTLTLNLCLGDNVILLEGGGWGVVAPQKTYFLRVTMFFFLRTV